MFLHGLGQEPPISLHNTSALLVIELALVNVHLASINLKYLVIGTSEEEKFILYKTQVP